MGLPPSGATCCLVSSGLFSTRAAAKVGGLGKKVGKVHICP